MPLLLYSGDESYRRTAVAPGDVDEGLLRYLRGGGCLMVMPCGPMPFYYDEHGASVGNSAKFGLPLSVAGPDGGWEEPPAGVELSFAANREALPNLPETIPFPVSGDPRWRPLVRRRLAPRDVLVPLLELRDASGASYGLGAAYIEHRESEPVNAKLVYVWFGLLETPRAVTLIHDLYGFIGHLFCSAAECSIYPSPGTAGRNSPESARKRPENPTISGTAL
jgi:hypothetical protein